MLHTPKTTLKLIALDKLKKNNLCPLEFGVINKIIKINFPFLFRFIF